MRRVVIHLEVELPETETRDGEEISHAVWETLRLSRGRPNAIAKDSTVTVLYVDELAE